MKINNFIKIDYFLRRAVEKAYKENTRKHAFYSFDEIDDILILFDLQDWNYIERIVKDLQRNKKRVFAWTVKPRIKEREDYHTTILPEYVTVIDMETDVDWKQIMQSHVTEKYSNLQYKTLLDLSIGENLHLTYLLRTNNSDLCIGFREMEEKIYDFIILKEEDKDLYETYEQMKFYLNNMFGSSNNS